MCKISATILLLIISAATSFPQSTLPGSRDAWLWPFDQTSIWNMPIGSNAVLQPAHLQAAGNVGVDIQHILKLKSSDPLRQVFGSTTFRSGRCSGTEAIGLSLNVHDNWIVPDAGNSPYGGTPNSNFAFNLPNSDTVFEGSLVSRCIAAGPVYLPDWMKYPANQKHQSLKGDGLHGGGQGASGMSALGGTIRRGEFTGSNPIRHAIKINPWAAKYCYYSSTIPGWKWPARSADSYASTGYNATGDSNIVMGSLFAIPSNITESSLNLQTAQRLFARHFHSTGRFASRIDRKQFASDYHWENVRM